MLVVLRKRSDLCLYCNLNIINPLVLRMNVSCGKRRQGANLDLCFIVVNFFILNTNQVSPTLLIIYYSTIKLHSDII